jgi:hypothetical protein
MATRSEQFHANEQRRGEAPEERDRRAAKSKPGVPPSERSRSKKHAEKKATYALEESTAGAKPSRKSTRKSANRAKPDTNLTLRESLQKGSPEARYRKTSAKRDGSPASDQHK